MAEKLVSFFDKVNRGDNYYRYLDGIANVDSPFYTKFKPTATGLELLTSLNKAMINIKRENILSITIESKDSITKRDDFQDLQHIDPLATSLDKKDEEFTSYMIILYKTEDEKVDAKKILIECIDERSFEDFTAIKKNLIIFWNKVDNEPNFLNDWNTKKGEIIHKKTDKNQLMGVGCLLLVVIALIIYLLMHYDVI